MGYYINPPDKSKEQFLIDHGVRVTHNDLVNFNFEGNDLPVCLVDNGWMTAAGICYDQRELEVWLLPDTRPMKFYVVPRKLLEPYL